MLAVATVTETDPLDSKRLNDCLDPERLDGLFAPTHLEELIDAGIVERVEHEPNKSENDLPLVFFGLTEEGGDFLEAHRLFRAEETLRHFYDAVTKPEEIERYETAPRPE